MYSKHYIIIVESSIIAIKYNRLAQRGGRKVSECMGKN